MFEHFDAARRAGAGRLRGLMIVLSLVAHALAVLCAVLWSFWKIERVSPKYTPISFMRAAAPPPPPPAAAPPPAPRSVAHRVAPIKAHELAQPIPQRTEPTQPPDGSPQATVDHGLPDGVPGGDPNSSGSSAPGVGDGPPVATLPDPEPQPIKLDSRAVEARRIAGDPRIALPTAVKQALYAQGTRRLVVPVHLCIGSNGAPSRIKLGKPTGFEELDAKIIQQIGEWRYSAYRVGASAVPVCTVVVIDYQIE